MAPKPKSKAKTKTVDEYLAALSSDKRAALERLRKIIQAAAPRAEECISYQIPAFRLDGKAFVWFGAAANHCAIYGVVGEHVDELEEYDTNGKGTIRFKPANPLPATLVRKLVKARIAKNAARVLVAVLLTSLGACQKTVAVQREATAAPVVVFVCEHGNVKSLIGASLFDQVAKERGLPFRAVSRGLNPEASVPPKIADALRSDGVEVATFKPQPLTSLDVSAAIRVIAIGVDLSSFSSGARVPIEVWGDVPPASVDYAASRDALLRHIGVLLDDLQAEPR